MGIREFDPDDFVENIAMKLVFLWGPFYAVFYFVRLIWRELFNREE